MAEVIAMELRDAIYTRRSVRAYSGIPVEREIIQALLDAAVQAPSAMNEQNWAFGVIQGADAVQAYGGRARLALLEMLDRQGITGEYRDRAANPDFNPFYNAQAVVVIYATTQDRFGPINCSLAAQNLMLAARELNLGTCWIGSATPFFNDPAVKAELNIPPDYTEIVTVIVGYPAGEMGEMEKNPPAVVYWITA
jgi:nitroreductase